MNKFESDLPVKEVFTGKLFKIPDYQRGYSWEKDQLEDLWEDIQNVRQATEHYTGLITLSDTDSEEDSWTDFNAYSVIDGQQRLSTLVILINAIVKKAKALGIPDLDRVPIDKIIEKYLYETHSVNLNNKASKLSYSSDDPSDEYFKTKILKLSEPQNGVQTAYTQRLEFANTFFGMKLENYEGADLSELFKIVTTKLVFNVYYIKEDNEVSSIFESLNNRGKGLSTLELLKNRLMYLSEKLKNCQKESKSKLRGEIRKSWKIVYEWLGKKELMDDDDFLRVHWIMYFTYNRHKSNALKDDLLDNEFAIKRIYDPSNLLAYDGVHDYAKSLSDAVKHWYYMKHPDEAHFFYKEKISKQLEKLNRLDGLGYHTFEPLVLALLMNYSETEKVDSVEEVLILCERYIFKVLGLAGKPSNTGDSYFYQLARRLYYKEISLDDLSDAIREQSIKYENIESFQEDIDELFRKQEGFYDWSFIGYFLFEYDLHLREEGRGSTGRAIDWNEYYKYKKEYVSVEHIYPQKDDKECWKNAFLGYDEEQKKALKRSLGNLLPLSIQRNTSFQNHCFDEKKNDGRGGGYYVGSYSEAEVNNLNKWNAEEILKRGLDMLNFMEDNWKIKFEDKVKLLHLEFVQQNSYNAL